MMIIQKEPEGKQPPVLARIEEYEEKLNHVHAVLTGVKAAYAHYRGIEQTWIQTFEKAAVFSKSQLETKNGKTGAELKEETDQLWHARNGAQNSNDRPNAETAIQKSLLHYLMITALSNSKVLGEKTAMNSQLIEDNKVLQRKIDQMSAELNRLRAKERDAEKQTLSREGNEKRNKQRWVDVFFNFWSAEEDETVNQLQEQNTELEKQLNDYRQLLEHMNEIIDVYQKKEVQFTQERQQLEKKLHQNEEQLNELQRALKKYQDWERNQRPSYSADGRLIASQACCHSCYQGEGRAAPQVFNPFKYVK
ncbi:hypothetical protein [Bacillus xiapuensis]|uniref:hypothetical protein n=1 Tax=Bacillus xiapuensis TaxID=2014075 RepID=UPI000C2498FF|nr:hypothetical protein [Bacillus xiapuensis]